jgi:acetylornithine deacetylase/succinyl-diaminopimelate desuccinylase-like protein
MRLDWDAGYPATRAPMTAPASRAVLQSVESVLGGPVIALPTLGGSLPMYMFEEVLKAPLIVLPIVNHDNSQHAANENLRVQNLWDGIAVYAGVIAEMGKRWPSVIP